MADVPSFIEPCQFCELVVSLSRGSDNQGYIVVMEGLQCLGCSLFTFHYMWLHEHDILVMHAFGGNVQEMFFFIICCT